VTTRDGTIYHWIPVTNTGALHEDCYNAFYYVPSNDKPWRTEFNALRNNPSLKNIPCFGVSLGSLGGVFEDSDGFTDVYSMGMKQLDALRVVGDSVKKCSNISQSGGGGEGGRCVIQ